MCGITGWFSSTPIPPQEIGILKRMTHAIKHRGPDDMGTELLTNAALGHVRLSIIDLSSGKQPMKSHDQRFTIIFNGEIYNYKLLRKELLQLGHRFETQSDTEVIMELYREFGHQGFSKLRGMYAFCLWDEKDNFGLLARDPLGIKPLFISTKGNSTVSFGSEAKAILENLDATPELDTGQLHLLMNFRYIPGNSSLFSGIQQLAPGNILRWSPIDPIEYFTIEIPSARDGETLEQIKNSVELHLTSDVEVGCYLSGGIDSSTIAVIGQSLSSDDFRTFTIDVGDDPKEAIYAKETAAYFGMSNFQNKIDQNATQQLSDLLWHLEVPKINALQNWQLAKFTSQYVKVTLSGLGGDELFLGYNIHKIMSQADRLAKFLPMIATSSIGSSFKNIYSRLDRLRWSENERSLNILEQLGNWPKVYGLIRNVWDKPQLRRLIYGERMLDTCLPNAFEYLEHQWPGNTDPVMAAASYEWSQKMVNDLLWQEDRVSMAHGLEVRTPLVDTLLYSHLRNYSRSTLMEKGQPKTYMKKIVSPILPDQILNRPKSGFQIASHIFFHSHLTLLAEEHLNPAKMKEVGLFNYEFVKHVLKFRPSIRLRWHYFILYLMILTHLWVQLFEKNALAKK